jgi:hypothetical protein
MNADNVNVNETFSIRQKNGKLKYFIKKQCVCGSLYITRKDGKAKSCGCLNRELNKKRRLGKKAYNRHTDAEKIRLINAKTIFKQSYKKDENDLDFETFMILSQLNCCYCGSPPSNKYHIAIKKDGQQRTLQKRFTKDGEIYYTKVWASDFENSHFVYSGLDRIIQNLPHNKDNVITCCRTCNFMKNTQNKEEFLNQVRKIYECQMKNV